MKHLYLRWWLLAALLLVTAAWAQTTPAGVIITNQASADFVDSTGGGQTTLSNAVEVVVLPVYSFNVEPDRDGVGADQDPTGGAANNGGLDASPNTVNPDGVNTLTDVNAGSTVTFSYTLDNDANINDVFDLAVRQDADDDFNFTGIQIYTFDDLNDNGVYDPATEAGTLSIQGGATATISLAADDGAGEEDGGTAGSGLVGNDSVNIVVFADIPPGTPGGDTALLDLVATSQGATAAGDTEPNVLYENNNVSSATVNETPVIGISEGISNVTNNGDGTYTVTYELFVENLGNVDLDNISLTNSMADTFLNNPPAANQAGAINIDSVNVGGFTANPTAYDGDGVTELLDPANSTLAIGATETVEIVVTVTNPDVGFVYNNQTIALGTSTGASGVTVGDYSDDGTPPFAAGDPDPNNNGDPGADAGDAGEAAGSDLDDADEDTPTPVSFTENPQIGISKQLNSVTPVTGAPGEYNVGFTLRIENFGDVPLSNIQVEENLAAAFNVGNTTVVGITSGPTTPATTNLGNTGFTINTTDPYNGVGNNNLLQGTNNLAVNDFTTIAFTVRINIDSDGAGGTPAGPGSYTNTATATGDSPSGTPVDDDSQNGPNPDPDDDDDPTNNDDPTPVNITEDPILGVAKDVGTVTDNGDGSYNVPYIIRVQNYGNVALSNVQVTDDLTNTFVNPTAPQPIFNVIGGSIASPTLTVNAGFDGTGNNNLLDGSDTLAVGATATITFTVRVEPNIAQGIYDNQAFGSGDSPGGTTVTDTSQDGNDPDNNSTDPAVNGDGDPSNNSDPTRVIIPSDPVIGVAKRVTGVDIDTPTAGTYRVTYAIVVENLGPIPLTNVQVQDNLSTTFGITPFAITVTPTASGTLAANGSYDGSTDINLLNAATSTLAVNTTETITLVVDVTPAGVPTREYLNQAFASATDPSGNLTTADPSDNGFDPDPDGDDNPNETDDGIDDGDPTSDSNENDPTPLIILGPSDLELVKTQYICADDNNDGDIDDDDDGTCDTIVAGSGAPGVDTQLEAEPGQYIVYTVVGTNTSASDVTDVFIQDIIPNPTEFVDSNLNTVSDGTLQCDAGSGWELCPTATPANVNEVRLNDAGGTVAAGATRTLTFVVRIP